jgi:16S rRNA (guanine527-N7)-methyltransferase
MSKGGISVFPKGKAWKKEVDQARKSWHFDLDVLESTTDPKAAILRIGGITSV